MLSRGNSGHHNPYPLGVAAGCCVYVSVTLLNYSCHVCPFVVCGTEVCSAWPRETQMYISEPALYTPKDSHGHRDRQVHALGRK